jgi:hypothetical protein
MNLRPDEQEFRVWCWRPCGGVPRAKARDQDEEKTEVYVRSRGMDIEHRMKNAKRKAKRRMSLYGYDRFTVLLTIADAEKRADTIEREMRQRYEAIIKAAKKTEE